MHFGEMSTIVFYLNIVWFFMLQVWYIAFIPFFIGSVIAIWKHKMKFFIGGILLSIPFSFLIVLIILYFGSPAIRPG